MVLTSGAQGNTLAYHVGYSDAVQSYYAQRTQVNLSAWGGGYSHPTLPPPHNEHGAVGVMVLSCPGVCLASGDDRCSLECK